MKPGIFFLKVLPNIGVAKGPAPPSIEMPPMTTNLFFFSFSFFQHLRVQQYTRTTVINNYINNQGAQAPQFNFSNQFKCIALMKLGFFVPKVIT